METSYSKYQLWSPPALDLSLDSFSNDLIQEFDKTRSNIDTIGKSQTDLAISLGKEPESKNEVINKHEQNDEAIAVSGENDHHNDGLPTPDPSSVTLPPSEREVSLHDEDSSSTANLFRKSSTFLKKKLSQNGGSIKKDESSIIQTTNAEDITNIVSRQYPPKPLQYSPVVEPSSSNHTSIVSTASQAESVRNNKDTERSSILPSAARTSGSTKRASNPISLVSNSTTDYPSSSLPPATRAITTAASATTPTVTTTSAPKRRSFFSLRFC